MFMLILLLWSESPEHRPGKETQTRLLPALLHRGVLGGVPSLPKINDFVLISFIKKILKDLKDFKSIKKILIIF